MLPRLFLFCAFITFSPVAHAQDCTGPNGVIGDIIYNNTYDMFQGCSTLGWMAFHKPLDSLPDCPNIGDTCTGNGTIYAGTYEGHKYYITAADAPGTVVTGGTGSGTYTWNNGSGTRPDLDSMFVPNCMQLGTPRLGNRWADLTLPECSGARGMAYTTYEAMFVGGGSPNKAASYCYHLGKPSDPSGPANPLAHGRADWYLPAIDELEFLYDSLGAAPAHSFQNALYWSSAEYGPTAAWTQNFNSALQGGSSKNSGYRVRCVRK